MLPIKRSVSRRRRLLKEFGLSHKFTGWTWNFFLSRLMACFRQTVRAWARLSSPVCWSGGVFFHFSPFFTTGLSFLLPLPSTAPLERLFLELTWLFKDVKFILCHGFSGRKLLFCFLPPNLLFASFSVSSCCLSKACSLSPTHFFSSSTSRSFHYSHTSLHTYTLLLISLSFLSVFYHFLLGKKIFQSVLSLFATFFFSVCGRNFQSGTLQFWLQVLHLIVIVAKHRLQEKRKEL